MSALRKFTEDGYQACKPGLISPIKDNILCFVKARLSAFDNMSAIPVSKQSLSNTFQIALLEQLPIPF